MGIAKSLGRALSPIAMLKHKVDKSKRQPIQVANPAEKQETVAEFKKEAEQATTDLKRKTELERRRANKFALRSLRSKRAASYFTPTDANPEQSGAGSKTIG